MSRGGDGLGRAAPRSRADSISTIGHLTEAVGAVLVLAETCILFAGVVSRYVFNSPLMWTDELATFLFLWLSMLGMVVAFRRNEHMRLTTFVNSVRPNGGVAEYGRRASSSLSSSSKSCCPRRNICRSSNRPS